MRRIIQAHKCVTSTHAFTLLELLVVVAILAAVAFVATGTYRGASEQADDGVVRAEMQEIVKAIRQFKADTGYYPKTGPFDLDTGDGVIDPADLDEYGCPAGQENAWFYSPANFYQLLSRRSPLDVDYDPETIDHPLEQWNVETGRGWRGPYLIGYTEGFVTISDDINDGSWLGDVDGDPVETLGADEIEDVPSIADPFEHQPVGADELLEWRVAASGEPLDRWGRPFLFLDTNADVVVTEMALVSFGADGDLATDDDIVLYVH